MPQFNEDGFPIVGGGVPIGAPAAPTASASVNEDGFPIVQASSFRVQAPAPSRSPLVNEDGFSIVHDSSSVDSSPAVNEDGFPIVKQSKPTQKPVNSDAPWYSKAWDWANEPTVNLKREGATGVEAGVEDVASSLTSPLSIALAFATFGT